MTPNVSLAPSGLRPVADLARARGHGDRLRYLAGCHCADCRRANSAYEKARAQARKAGEWNGLVSAEKARAHLAALSEHGVGYRSVRDIAGISGSILQKIKLGKKTRIRALTERAILGVSDAALADGARIPAGPTWALLDALLADGYRKVDLAREMGYRTRAVQFSRNTVSLRNAYEVERLYARLRCVDAKPALRRLDALYEECYSARFIVEELAALAEASGSRPPDLTVRNGRMRADTVALVKTLHARLMD